MAEYVRAVRKGFRFLYEPRRWLPLFALDAVFFVAVAVLFATSIAEFLSALSRMEYGLALLQAGPAVIGAALSAVAWFALRFFVLASMVHQTFHEKEFAKSWRAARQRYLSLVGALFVVTSAGMMAAMIPFAGVVFSILVSWAFFFVFQDLMSTNRDSLLALNNSMKIFKRRPLSVIASWLLVSFLAAAVLILFALPLVVLFFNMIAENAALGITDPSQMVAAMLVSLRLNLAAFLGTGLILVLGVALSTALAFKVQTELYKDIKKELKPLVFRLLP